ncbi:DNA ligase D [Luteolibacter yonseiensis]|uniref:DNA ligase (ATP) n=1 Tax=Luteolibacter yonseiensis TaxID=1144680 RepID=A0A934V966_9BACT|nr:DNA ligase D [Luteolibacter yonseiensis]MBK1818002.1 DNA ligase D [Luteolibacter yonseiensis]
MKIATYNVNGINGRLPVLLRWLEMARPDVVCLQELKASQEKFPLSSIEKAGYGAIWQGEKSWNGVAILAKGTVPVEIRRGLPGGRKDTQSRYLEAAVEGVIIGCLYLPNGNPAPGPKFDYKLRWFERLAKHAENLLAEKVPVALVGDFNVMPTPLDVYDPEGWKDDALFRSEVREEFGNLMAQGWIDAIRSLRPEERIYTFWKYLRNAWGRNAGLRIDHFLLSPQLASRLKAADVDRDVRGWEHSSDHAPVWIELASKEVARRAVKAPKKQGDVKRPAADEGSKTAPLAKYHQKRDFDKTPEPGGKVPRHAGNSFVVQEHHARAHHFDFRLEMDGVLVSWAVPKGIPEDTAAKRLAVHVEDHPLEYGEFEGVIPKGNYGAGTVAIWDKGEWQPMGPDWKKDFAKGTLKFRLKGDRLNGPYLLARMKEEPNWMLKMLDPATHPFPSVKADREVPRFVSPQLARVVPSVPAGHEWLHEIKFDGYRLIAVRADGKLTLHTRSGLDWTDRFEETARHLSKISTKDFVMDGEAVVFDDKGRTSFGDLQAALKSGGGGAITFMAFDLLHFDGLNLRNLPLSDRIKRLSELVGEEPGPVRRSTVWPAAMGEELFRQAASAGLEGIISKNAVGRYVEGSRKDWTKSKVRPRQEFVICGYTPPKGSLPAFGALVLGTYENGKLIPRGKVGTGFSGSRREELLPLFQKLATAKAHFKIPEKKVIWIKPRLVAEIEFAEITRDGSIRQGSFLSLREDKAASEVHLDGIQMAVADGKESSVAGVRISHPDRMVFPGDQISKMEVARYFERVGDLMLPFVVNRPLAVLRAPSGITGEMFFQKSFPSHIPDHVYQSELPDGSTVFSIRDVKGLVSLAQFGALEVHPWGAPLPAGEKPDFLTWDLDPDASVPWNEVLGAALLLRDYLEERGLAPLIKTSGGKGLHIMLHIKRTQEWEVMKAFTKAVAVEVAAFNRKRFITTASKSKRQGKIFIDWLRNGRGATCVCPWGLRARPGATVSMPVTWEQLPEIAAAGFTIHEPPETPREWISPKPQTVSKKLLRDLKII